MDAALQLRFPEYQKGHLQLAAGKMTLLQLLSDPEIVPCFQGFAIFTSPIGEFDPPRMQPKAPHKPKPGTARKGRGSSRTAEDSALSQESAGARSLVVSGLLDKAEGFLLRGFRRVFLSESTNCASDVCNCLAEVGLIRAIQTRSCDPWYLANLTRTFLFRGDIRQFVILLLRIRIGCCRP